MLSYLVSCGFPSPIFCRSVLIEANPRIYPKLVENRPHTHRYSYAASCSLEDEAANVTVGFWSSIFTNAVQDNTINRMAYAEKSSGVGPKKVEVPCGSLTPVLMDSFPNGRIHFLSLDVGTCSDANLNIILRNF